MATTYVPRAFGGTLVLNVTPPITVPGASVTWVTRDGKVTWKARDGQVSWLARDGQIIWKVRQ